METTSDTNINIRVNGQLKAEAYEIFEKIGVKPSDAVRMFLAQVTMHRGIPFEVKIPNDETIAAMEDKGTVVDDIDTFFDEILEAAEDEKSH